MPVEKGRYFFSFSHKCPTLENIARCSLSHKPMDPTAMLLLATVEVFFLVCFSLVEEPKK